MKNKCDDTVDSSLLEEESEKLNIKKQKREKKQKAFVDMTEGPFLKKMIFLSRQGTI